MKLRTALMMATASQILFLSNAYAQEFAGDVEVNDVIVVTGSRISRDGYSTPTPVTVTKTEDLFATTPTNIPDALNKLPQFQLSSSPSRSTHNFANTSTHGNILNLRGVGGNRTLILMDGVRVSPTTYNGDVDTNVIPSMLIDRVEVVTGGASAVYGSDAVAGVVNFVLDKDFTGVKGVVQGGSSMRGDNEHYRLGLAGGKDFAGDKGHVIFSAETFSNEGMLRSDRELGSAGYIYTDSVANCTSAIAGACSPGGSANPFTIVSDSRIPFGNDLGLIASGPAGFPYAQHIIRANGELTPFDRGTGSGVFTSGGDGYTIPLDLTAVAPNKTYQLFGRADYDIGATTNAYVQASFSRSDLQYSSLANSWTGGTNAPIFSGNPYLTAELQAALGPNDMISVGNYNGNGPKPITDERTDFLTFGAGAEGEFSNGWGWNVAYTHSDSQHNVDQSGLYNWQRAYAAVDAVRDGSGNIVCRATLDPDPTIAARFAGCSPLNVLGVDPSVATPEGYAYATGTSSYEANFKQDLIAVGVNGSLFSLPAGPVDVAVGGEYRSQSLNLTSNADPALLDTAAEKADHFAGLRGVAPSALYYWLTNVGVADGDLDVLEAYAEANIPLLADQAGFQSLDLNVAGRITDYSISGTVETWKVGLKWKPISDLLLRGTISKDIRAPSLFNIYQGDQSGIGTLFDPVSGLQQNIPQVFGGNPNLVPEESDTFTIGAVFTPSSISGLSLSVDYFSLDIEGAIGALSVAQIVNNCFNDSSAPECALITRPTPTSFPTSVRITSSNIAFLNTAGIDFDASYRIPEAGPGDLSLRLFAHYLTKYETQQNADSAVLDYRGVATATSIPVGRPKLSAMLNARYDIGGLSLNVSEQYIGKMTIGRPGLPENFVEDKVKAIWYTDLTMSYNFEQMGGDFEVFATVNNLFDQDAPLVPATVPGVNLATIISVYDTVGRAVTVGTRFKF